MKFVNPGYFLGKKTNFIQIPTEILDADGLSAKAFLVYSHLVRLYNKTARYAWPSYTYLSAKTGYHRQALTQAIEELESLHLIHRERTKKKDGSPGSTHYYFPDREYWIEGILKLTTPNLVAEETQDEETVVAEPAPVPFAPDADAISRNLAAKNKAKAIEAGAMPKPRKAVKEDEYWMKLWNACPESLRNSPESGDKMNFIYQPIEEKERIIASMLLYARLHDSAPPDRQTYFCALRRWMHDKIYDQSMKVWEKRGGQALTAGNGTWNAGVGKENKSIVLE